MRIGIAQEVPGRTCPLGHGIRLTLCRASTAGTGCIYPVCHGCQRRLTVVRRLIGLHLRQLQRKLALVKRHIAALLTLYNRNWLSPVTLSGEYPVAELEVGLAVADALLLEESNDLLLCVRHGQSVQEVGIYQRSRRNIGIYLLLYADRASRNDLDDREVKFLCKVPVSLIMCGNRHDCTGSVGHQHIVRNPDRNLLAIHGICRSQSVDLYSGLILRKLGTLKVRLLRRLLPVSHESVIIPDFILVLIDDRMLRGNNHVGRAEQGVRSRRVDAELIFLARQCEIHLRTGGLSDPVSL